MCDWTRKTIQKMQPKLSNKFVWTKNEKEAIQLLERYLPLGTTKANTESFLQNHHLSFRIESENEEDLLVGKLESTGITSIILINLPGPNVWDGGWLPFGSKYDAQLHFKDDILSDIRISHFVYHF